MKNILIVNGSIEFASSKGTLNESLTQIAKDLLLQNNYNIKVTNVSTGYDIDEEIEKFLWADYVIYQFPVWWMATPWFMKKYIDEVFMAGYGKLFANDGRDIADASKKYGTGGLVKDKKYMLSVTFNAPLEAFTEENQFFEGKGIDILLFSVHKAHEFLGMKRMPTFMCNDVVKNPNFDTYVKDYKEHLKTNFIA